MRFHLFFNAEVGHFDATDSCSVTLSDRLWNNSLHIAEKAFKTEFVQEIAAGKLNPISFTSYNLQDAVYIELAASHFATAAKKCDDIVLGSYLLDKSHKYKDIADVMYKALNIDPDGKRCINLNDAAKRYTDYQELVAEIMHPIYTLVAILPCNRLWPWIGKELQQEDPKPDFGVYKNWAAESFNGSYNGYEKVEKWVNDYYNDDKINEDEAKEVYNKCMEGELNFFSSAIKK